MARRFATIDTRSLVANDRTTAWAVVLRPGDSEQQRSHGYHERGGKLVELPMCKLHLRVLLKSGDPAERARTWAPDHHAKE